MADRLFGFLKMIPNLKARMLRLNWNSKVQIANITKPVFIISGSHDVLVPSNMSDELFAAAAKSEGKEYWMVLGGEHNNTFLKAGPDYVRRLREFMSKALGEEVPVEEMAPEELSKVIDEQMTAGQKTESSGDFFEMPEEDASMERRGTMPSKVADDRITREDL